MSGRPWKIEPDELIPKLRRLRERDRLSLKAISTRLGYSVEHLRKLCGRFKIYLRLKPQTDIDAAHEQNLGYAAEGARQHGNHPAVSEAKPDDTRPAGSL